MKHLLLLITLIAPATALAQADSPILIYRTVLYRHLSDTLTGHYALRLRRGSLVQFAAQYGSHWLSVRREYYAGTGFVQDTTRYFMRKRVIKKMLPGA